MILIGEALDRIRFLLLERDASNSAFTDEDLVKCLIQRLNDMAVKLNISNSTEEVSTTASAREYDLPTNIIHVRRVWITDNGVRIPLRPIAVEDALSSTASAPDGYYIKEYCPSRDTNYYSYTSNPVPHPIAPCIKLGLSPVPDRSLTVYVDCVRHIGLRNLYKFHRSAVPGGNNNLFISKGSTVLTAGTSGGSQLTVLKYGDAVHSTRADPSGIGPELIGHIIRVESGTRALIDEPFMGDDLQNGGWQYYPIKDQGLPLERRHMNALCDIVMYDCLMRDQRLDEAAVYLAAYQNHIQEEAARFANQHPKFVSEAYVE